MEKLGGEQTAGCGVYDYSTNSYAGIENDNVGNVNTIVNSSTTSGKKQVSARVQKTEGKTSSSGSNTINIIQPSITCYMWKRVA